MGIIYFVRHGETCADKQHRFNGGIDLDLNKAGVRQAQSAGEKLSSIEFDEIFCSPKKRTVQTCEILSRGQSFKIDNRLSEIVCGRFDGQKKSLIRKLRFLGAFKKGKHGVEHIGDFTARNVDFCEYLLESMKDKTVLVISHNGNASAFNYFFEGRPEKYNFAKHSIKNGEIIEFEY